MVAAYQLLPGLSDDELAALAASIREHGVIEPVLLDDAGNILDGHHRVMLADSLGINYPRHVLPGMDEAQKRILAVELNCLGRDKTDARRAYAGMLIEPDVEAVSLARRDRFAPVVEKFPQLEQGKTRDIIARKVGLGSGRTYENYKRLLQWAESERPDLVPALKAGARTMKHVRAAYRDWAKANDAGEPADVGASDEPGSMPDGGFRVILADPPWQYAQKSDRLNGTTDRHYTTMTSLDIMNLPVADIAADDAALLLWTTWPFLPDALDIIIAWGFSYVTGLPWIKIKEIGTDFGGEVRFKPQYGVGHWIRGASEPLLIARRGKMPAISTGLVGLLSENAYHSRKPSGAHELAEALGAPRIELFGRARRPGWTVVGDAVDDGQDIRERLYDLVHRS